jgi:hypothetical protein
VNDFSTAADPPWSGDARAHWEGETLVVDTTNFNNRTRSFLGAGTAGNKVVTERFTRRSAKLLDYEATIVDPKTFQDKVVVAAWRTPSRPPARRTVNDFHARRLCEGRESNPLHTLPPAAA